MKTKRNYWLALGSIMVLLMLASFTSFSQKELSWLNNLNKEDSAAINALVLYPDSIRLSIFEACKSPEVIVRTAVLQKNTSNDFTNLLGKYSRKEQEEIWNLTRYPGLIDGLVSGGKKSKDEINKILQNYPDEVHEDALNYGRNYYDLLQQIDQLDKSSRRSFDDILHSYPSATRSAFYDLIDLPEVLSLLYDHMQMSVLVGDMYKRNPQQLIRITDSLNIVVANQNAQDLAAWEKTVEEDTNVQSDLRGAALDYAQQNCDYDQETCTRPASTDYVDNYFCYPYPYWFGYPYWYPYYYWYPYPYWFDWGFYFDPWGHFVFIGLPSYYFTYWYFYYPYNYYHYPYVCDAYITHYYGPRDVVNDNTNIVRNWVNEKKDLLPPDFNSNPTNRINAIKQVGQLETDNQNFNVQSPNKPLSRDEFLKKNQEHYPALNTAPKQRAVDKNQPQVITEEKVPPVKQPPARLPSGIRQPEQKQKPVPPKFDFEKVNPAQEHHRSTWENATPKQNQPRQVAPPPRQPSAPKQPPSPPKNKPR